MELLTLDQINAAADRLRPVIRLTPVIASRVLSDRTGEQVWLKCENLQRTGSFKPRGAFTNMLLRPVPKAGVVAATGGNHGAAVAYAAMKLGHPAKIFVPTVASAAKLDRIRGYGADLVVTGSLYAESLAAGC